MATQKELEAIKNIFEVAIKVNAQRKYSVWAEFHGHVDTFEVRVSPLWKEGVRDIEGWGCCEDINHLSLSTNFQPTSYTSKDDYALFVVEKLGNLKRELEKFLSEEAI